MIIRQSTERLTLRDSPGCSWLLGALFLVIGGLVVAGPLGLFSSNTGLSVPVKVLAIACGCVAFVFGVYAVYRAPLTVSTFDRTRRVVIVERRGLSGVTAHRFPFSDITGVEVAEDHDNDGVQVFQVGLRLQSGALAPLSDLWAHDRDVAENSAAAIERFLGLSPSAPTSSPGIHSAD